MTAVAVNVYFTQLCWEGLPSSDRVDATVSLFVCQMNFETRVSRWNRPKETGDNLSTPTSLEK